MMQEATYVAPTQFPGSQASYKCHLTVYGSLTLPYKSISSIQDAMTSHVRF